MFNSLGYLAPGFHDWTFNEIKENLVVPFKESSTRVSIFDGYTKLVSEIIHLVGTAEQWVDGSYVTHKINPGDLDLVNIIDKEKIDLLNHDQQFHLRKLVSGKVTRETHSCDSYIVLKVPDHHPHKKQLDEALKYWEDWFGIDRNGVPKGKVRTIVG